MAAKQEYAPSSDGRITRVAEIWNDHARARVCVEYVPTSSVRIFFQTFLYFFFAQTNRYETLVFNAQDQIIFTI